MFFLLEYIRGQELFDVIREIGVCLVFPSSLKELKGLLNYQQAQYYVASLILVMEYLHTLGIIYRDIKPENIIIASNVSALFLLTASNSSSKGQLKLLDMGTAKMYRDKSTLTTRTFTILGTPHYMAPEIIGGKGYTLHVDLWSIGFPIFCRNATPFCKGIMLYEFMVGVVPFGEDVDDPYQIYELIIKKTVGYPSYFKDKKSQKFIDHLLNKIPDLRLGDSYTTLKANTWFEKFDWVTIFF